MRPQCPSCARAAAQLPALNAARRRPHAGSPGAALQPLPTIPRAGGALALAAIYADSPVVISLFAFATALIGNIAGAKFGKEYSGKLFCVTFLIVAPTGIAVDNPIPL